MEGSVGLHYVGMRKGREKILGSKKIVQATTDNVKVISDRLKIAQD